MGLKSLFTKLLGKADDVSDIAKYGDDIADIARYGDNVADTANTYANVLTPDEEAAMWEAFKQDQDFFSQLEYGALPDNLANLSNRFRKVTDNYTERIYKANDYIPASMSTSVYKLKDLGRRLIKRTGEYLGGSDDIRHALDNLDMALYDNDRRGMYLDIYRDVL